MKKKKEPLKAPSARSPTVRRLPCRCADDFAMGWNAAMDTAADLCLDGPTRLPFKKVKDDHPANGHYMHYADLVVRLDALAVAIRSLKKASKASAPKGTP